MLDRTLRVGENMNTRLVGISGSLLGFIFEVVPAERGAVLFHTPALPHSHAPAAALLHRPYPAPPSDRPLFPTN
jgi:hypothetical protein